MLSKCANPQCSARMKYMHDGSLYVVPTPRLERYLRSDGGEFSAPPGKQIECFWLCEACARELTISKGGELECRKILSPSWEMTIDTGPAKRKSDNTTTDVPVWRSSIPVGEAVGEVVSWHMEHS